MSTARVVLRLPAMIYCFHGTPLRLLDVGEVIWRPVLASMTAGLAAWWLDPATLMDGFRLLLQFAMFTAFWFIGMLAIPGGIGRLREGARMLRGLRGGEVVDVA